MEQQEYQKVIADLYTENMRLKRELEQVTEERDELARQAAGAHSLDISRRRKSERFAMLFNPALKLINDLAQKSPKALNVLVYLIENSSPDGSYAESVRSMAVNMGMSTSTLQGALKMLEKHDFMIRGSAGGSNIYAINPAHCLKMSRDQKGRAAYYTIKNADKVDSVKACKRSITANVRVDTRGIKNMTKEQEQQLTDFYPDVPPQVTDAKTRALTKRMGTRIATKQPRQSRDRKAA